MDGSALNIFILLKPFLYLLSLLAAKLKWKHLKDCMLTTSEVVLTEKHSMYQVFTLDVAT